MERLGGWSGISDHSQPGFRVIQEKKLRASRCRERETALCATHAPDAILRLMVVSATHAVASEAVCPTRAPLLYSAPPKFVPVSSITILPVAGMLEATPVGAGESYEKSIEVVPTCTPSVNVTPTRCDTPV